MLFNSSRLNIGFSGFFNGSSANSFIILTILVIGSVTILSVSDEIIIEPIHITKPVKRVTHILKIAAYLYLYLVSYQA